MKQLTFYAQNLISMRKKRKEREETIKNLEANVSLINKKVENLVGEIDKCERYSRQNCLLYHGIVETDNVVVNNLVIEMISTKMNTEVSPADLD